MPHHLKFALLIAAIVADDLKVRRFTTKLCKAYVELNETHEQTVAAQEARNQYLCHLLNEHDVEVDEFDMIALNFDTE